MTTPVLGVCALCRRTRELRDSHFLPKALYRLARASGKQNPHPVRVTLSGSQQTAFQARSRLLCSECEARFDQSGESWVMRNCYRGRGVFRLRECLDKANPIASEAELLMYSALESPGIDIDKLVYFCTSVFWRASIRDWDIDGQRYESLSLGTKYSEEIRLYLLGASSFPRSATVMVLLSKLRTPVLLFNFPDSIRIDEGWCHRLHIPGITFLLTIGKHSAESRVFCILRSPSHPIFVTKHGDARVQRSVLRLLGKVAPRGADYPLTEGFEGQ